MTKVRPASAAEAIVVNTSAADPGRLSRILDPNFFHPESKFFSSQIADPHQRDEVF
jgi:hypothetical protein